VCYVNPDIFFEFGILLFGCFVYRQNVTCLKRFTMHVFALQHYTGELKDKVDSQLSHKSLCQKLERLVAV